MAVGSVSGLVYKEWIKTEYGSRRLGWLHARDQPNGLRRSVDMYYLCDEYYDDCGFEFRLLSMIL